MSVRLVLVQKGGDVDVPSACFQLLNTSRMVTVRLVRLGLGEGELEEDQTTPRSVLQARGYANMASNKAPLLLVTKGCC